MRQHSRRTRTFFPTGLRVGKTRCRTLQEHGFPEHRMDFAGIRFGFRSHRDAVGAVLDLRRIAGSERACEDAVRSRECEKLSVTRQSEARVQLTFGLAAVLSGGKHEEVFAGAERHRGDAPLVWLVGTVAQGPPFQINGLLARGCRARSNQRSRHLRLAAWTR